MGKGAKGNQGAKAQGRGKAPAEEEDSGWGPSFPGNGGDNNGDDGEIWGSFDPLGDWDVPDEKPGLPGPPPAPPPPAPKNNRTGKQQNGPPPTVTLSNAGPGGFSFQPGVSAFYGPAGPAMNPAGMGNTFPSAFTNGTRFGTANAFPASHPGPPAKNNFNPTYPTSPQNGAFRTRFADEQPPAVIALGPPWPPAQPNQPAQGGAENGTGGKQKGNNKKQKGNPNQNNNGNSNNYQNNNNPNQNQGKKQKQQQRQENGWDDHAGDTWGDNTNTMWNDDPNAKSQRDNTGATWEDPLPGGGDPDDWNNDPYNPNTNPDTYQHEGGGQQEGKGGKKGKQKGKKNQNNDFNNDSWQQHGDRNNDKNNDGGWGVQTSTWNELGSSGFGLGLGGTWDEQPLPTTTLKGDTRGYGNPMLAPVADRTDAVAVKIEESGGKGLEAARHALYGTHRVSEARFMWILPYQHDPRVEWMIDFFIQQSSIALATLGFHKYLKSREKGALIVNVDYASEKRPSEPAFDWVVFSEVQKTRDRTIQQQIAANNPAKTCLVFVFLVSKSGNSLGIWRRKLPVPQSLQSVYQAQIRSVEADLRDKVYIVKVDPPMIAGTATDPRTAPTKTLTARPQKSSKLSNIVKWITWGSGGNKIKKKQKQNP